MRINKLLATLGLVLSMLLGSGVAVAADFDKGLMAYKAGDYKSALAEWTPLAEQGDAKAQYDLGWMYDRGEGVLKNYKTAVKWYTLAAEQGNAHAQGNLGYMYAAGEGVLKNHKTAVKWFTKAAEQGDSFAQFNLGNMYDNGEGVPEDDKTAMKWYALAAEQGNADAQVNLSRTLLLMGKEIFHAGIGGYDCSDAIEYFKQAKEAGSSGGHQYIEFCETYQRASKDDSEAQYQIAQHLHFGTLINKNPKTALSWAMKAARNGNKDAGSLIGEILIKDLVYGSGVQKLRDLGQVIDTVCSKDPKCAFDKVWEHLDISQDGSISLAELSKFQRDLVQFAYIEEVGDEVEVAEAAAINLTSILLLPITSSSILHSFDYNNDGTLQKEEVIGETEFATIVGVDSQSLLSGIKFEALGNKLSSALKGLPLPF